MNCETSQTVLQSLRSLLKDETLHFPVGSTEMLHRSDRLKWREDLPSPSLNSVTHSLVEGQ